MARRAGSGTGKDQVLAGPGNQPVRICVGDLPERRSPAIICKVPEQASPFEVARCTHCSQDAVTRQHRGCQDYSLPESQPSGPDWYLHHSRPRRTSAQATAPLAGASRVPQVKRMHSVSWPGCATTLARSGGTPSVGSQPEEARARYLDLGGAEGDLDVPSGQPDPRPLMFRRFSGAGGPTGSHRMFVRVRLQRIGPERPFQYRTNGGSVRVLPDLTYHSA